jgi:Ser/Thr protein kinase RdoA (MazF antagonist)
MGPAAGTPGGTGAARRPAESCEREAAVREAAARAVGRFPIAEPFQLERVPQGLMHVTWRVRSPHGDFALQALHPSMAGETAVADHAAVSAHLAARDFPAPRLVPAADGAPVLRRPGTTWRCTTWLDGRPGTKLASPGEARRAARLLGAFHRATADFDRPFEGGIRLHDPPAHAERLRDALRRSVEDPALARWHDAVREPVARALAALGRLALPAGLPERVIHGDPKVSNFVFDQAGQAVGLLDLDGCTRAPVLHDLGDAVRSWADGGAQAGPDRLREDIVVALVDGWSTAGLAWSPEERGALPQAAALVAWELAARFLRDVLEAEYFAWDPERFPDRRAQNLARAVAAADFAVQLEAAIPPLARRLDDRR